VGAQVGRPASHLRNSGRRVQRAASIQRPDRAGSRRPAPGKAGAHPFARPPVGLQRPDGVRRRGASDVGCRSSSERRAGGDARPADPTLNVTEASNVLSTPQTAAIPTLTTPRPALEPPLAEPRAAKALSRHRHRLRPPPNPEVCVEDCSSGNRVGCDIAATPGSGASISALLRESANGGGDRSHWRQDVNKPGQTAHRDRAAAAIGSTPSVTPVSAKRLRPDYRLASSRRFGARMQQTDSVAEGRRESTKGSPSTGCLFPTNPSSYVSIGLRGAP
jgi:hypothetical protein